MDYKKHDLKPGDIIFTFKKSSWLSTLIWKFSKMGTVGPFMTSHVCLYIGAGKVIDILPDGVVLDSLKRYNYSQHILGIGRVKGLEEYDREIIVMNATSDINAYKYSYKQIILLMFKKLFRLNKVKDPEKDKVICSEYIVNLFRRSNIDLLPGKKAHMCTPLDVVTSDILDVRYVKKARTTKH